MFSVQMVFCHKRGRVRPGCCPAVGLTGVLQEKKRDEMLNNNTNKEKLKPGLTFF